MAYQCRGSIKNLLTALIVLLNFILTIQESCTLPSGQQSTCIRLHFCKHFQDILRKYDRGIPPPDVAQNIRSHSCVTGGNVCCPDNATHQEVETQKPPQEDKTQSKDSSTSMKNDIDFDAIKNHRNINLINGKGCGVETSNRIFVGVNETNVRESRWVALIGYKLNDGNLVWQCGGTLISQRFVLTAANCISKDLALVRLGEYTISTQRDCDDLDQCADLVQDIMVERTIKHPDFNRKTKENDLALLKLVRPADLTKNNVKTICLPINPESDIEEFKKKNMKFVIAGWRKTESGESSDVLQKTFVPFIDLDTCNSIFNPLGVQIYPVQVCAGYSKVSGDRKIDSCKGDSGGGLVAFSTYNDKMRALLYGVISSGVKCEDPNQIYPSINVNVRYFLTWILDNISG